MLQAWALPIENNIGVGGFDLAPAANPLTSGVGREGSLGCSASSVPPERLRLSPIEGLSKIKVIEEGDFEIVGPLSQQCHERGQLQRQTDRSIELQRES